MLTLGCFALVAAIVDPIAIAGGDQIKPKSESVQLVYELYSWKAEATDEWQFSILSGLTSHVQSPKEVFGSERVVTGLNDLERQLASLPDGSDIVWMDRMLGLKRDPGSGDVVDGDPIAGLERVQLPPKAVVDKVRVLTKKHKLRLEVGTRGGR